MDSDYVCGNYGTPLSTPHNTVVLITECNNSHKHSQGSLIRKNEKTNHTLVKFLNSRYLSDLEQVFTMWSSTPGASPRSNNRWLTFNSCRSLRFLRSRFSSSNNFPPYINIQTSRYDKWYNKSMYIKQPGKLSKMLQALSSAVRNLQVLLRDSPFWELSTDKSTKSKELLNYWLYRNGNLCKET